MKHKWRTLIRIVSILEGKVEIIIPGIDTRRTFMIPKSEIPYDVNVDQRFHAHVNLDAESEEELGLTNWEEK